MVVSVLEVEGWFLQWKSWSLQVVASHQKQGRTM